MADTVEQSRELQIKMTLSNGNAKTTRTLTVADPKAGIGAMHEDMLQFKYELMNGDLANLIQPSAWRDDDPTMTPYTTDNVEFTVVETTKTHYDISSRISFPTQLTAEQLRQFFAGTYDITGTVFGYGMLIKYWVPTNSMNLEVTAGTNFSSTLSYSETPYEGEITIPDETDLVDLVVITATDDFGKIELVTIQAPNWTPRISK